MTIRFNVPGARRKELASAIAKKLDTAVSYVGAPSFAYHISDQVLEKDGSLVLCGLDDDAVAGLLSYLGDEGFTPAEPETAITVGGMTPDAVGNLKAMLAAKGYLIKKALGVETLNIETDHDSVTFPWFTREMTEVEKTACTHFLQALCSAAKNQKRASAREKPAENEKYAFRCYLLRLGFIGPQSKTDRRILLRNLAGSAAFKAPRTAAESEAKQ